MSDKEPEEEIIQLGMVTYDKTEAELSTLSRQFLSLTVKGVDDNEGLKKCHDARMVCVKTRTSIDKQRLAYGSDARDYIKKVNAKAAKLLALIEPAETHLTEQENIVKREQERLAAEAEARKQAVLRERLEKLAAVGSKAFPTDVMLWTDEEFTEQLHAATEAHEAKVAAEEAERKAREEEAERQRLEAERLAAERAKFEAEQAEARKAKEAEEEQRRKAAEAEDERLRKIQEDIDRERAEIQAERDKIQAEKDAAQKRIEAELREKERAEQLEREKAQAAERARIETEERLKREAEEQAAREQAEAEKAARREARRPWREKVAALADRFEAVEIPKAGKGCGEMRERVIVAIDVCVSTIRGIIEEGDDE